MTGTALIIFYPVELHDNDLLATQLAEDRLKHSTKLSAHVRRHEAHQGI